MVQIPMMTKKWQIVKIQIVEIPHIARVKTDDDQEVIVEAVVDLGFEAGGQSVERVTKKWCSAVLQALLYHWKGHNLSKWEGAVGEGAPARNLLIQGGRVATYAPSPSLDLLLCRRYRKMWSWRRSREEGRGGAARSCWRKETYRICCNSELFLESFTLPRACGRVGQRVAKWSQDV